MQVVMTLSSLPVLVIFISLESTLWVRVIIIKPMLYIFIFSDVRFCVCMAFFKYDSAFVL